MCDLHLAVDAFGRRKLSAASGIDDVHDPESNHRAWALLCAGTKVDAACLDFTSHQLAHVHIVHLAQVAASGSEGDLWGEIEMAIAGAYADGLLTGMLVENPPPRPRRPSLAEAQAIAAEWLAQFGLPVSTPLWTSRCKGVQEALRDRRRRPRTRVAHRVICAPATRSEA